MKNLTLRQLLSSIVDVHGNITNPTVFEYIYQKDKEMIYPREGEVTRGKTVYAYTHVIQELLSKPITEPYEYSIYVKWVDKRMLSPGDERYVDVCLFNDKAIEPPKGKKPWGGENYPKKTHYNVNDEKYGRYYAFGYCNWSDIIDTPVINKAKLKPAALLGEILWELTFNGFTEKDGQKFNKMLEKRLKESMKSLNKEFKNIDINI